MLPGEVRIQCAEFKHFQYVIKINFTVPHKQ